jgi:hypothetical protein
MDDAEDTGQNLCFSKIELIPLETDEESIIGNERDVIITDQFYIISDHLNIISIFDKKGNFISNSKKKLGAGPEEYHTFMGVSYNSISNSIDIFTPYYLIAYDINFNYLNKVKLPAKPKASEKELSHFFYSSYAINDNESIILPTMVSENPHRIVIYNTKEEKVTKEISYDDDIIAGISSQLINLFPANDSLIYFSPQAFSYVHYTIK